MSAAVRARRPHPGVRIVFDGTSLNNVPGDGYGGFTDPRRSFPFCAMTGTKTPFHVVAENANSWGSLAVTAATRLYPYGGKADNTVLVLNGGSLSFWDGLTGQQTYDAMVSYADNARANGFDFIIASTHTPYDLSAQGHPTGGEETARVAYNALIMANTAGDFDAVYDMAADPLDDPQDTSIYFDKAHFSIAGAHEAGARTFTFLTGLTLGLIPTSIAYDGTEDVTTAVNDWIDSMVSSGTTNLTFQPGGIYLINDGPIEPPSGVTINFNGATLLRDQILDVGLRYGLVTPYIMLRNVDDVTVRDGIISGINTNNGDLNALADSSALAAAAAGGRIVTDAVTTSGDATLTSATAVFVSGDVGVHVTGAGIPSGTSIISRTNATTVELSRNATATATGVTLNINVIFSFYESGGITLQNLNYPSGEPLGEYGVYCPALAFEMGIDVREGCDGITITNWDMTGVFGDYVDNQISDNVTITNLTGRRNGRQGIAINGGNNILISGCDIWSTRSGLDIEPTNGRSSTNIECSDSLFETHLSSFANNGHGPCDDIRFLRNTMPSGAGFMWQCIPGRTVTGVSITNGSPTVTGTGFTSSTYGSSVGQVIYGPGITSGTTVTARTSTTLTLSANATATATATIRIGTGLRSNYEIRDNVGTYEMSGGSNAYIMLEAVDGAVIDNNASVTDPSDNRSGVMFMNRRSTDIDVTDNDFDGCDDAVEDVIGGSDWTESGNTL